MTEISSKSTSSNGTRSKRYMMFLVFYMILYESFDTYTCSYYLAINSYIIDDFGINSGIWSYMIAIASIGYFFAIVMQFLADKVGRRPMMIVVFIGMGLSSFLLGFARDVLTFTFFMFFMFMFFTSDIWGIAMSEEAPPDKRAKYSSFILTVGIMSSMSIYVIRAFLIFQDPTDPTRYTWENMAFFGGLAIPLALLGYFMKETKAFEKMKEKNIGSKYTAENIKDSFTKPFQGKNRNIVIAFIVVGFILGLNYASLNTLEGFVALKFGDKEIWNTALIFAGLGSFFTFAMIGIASDKIGRKNVLYIYAITLFLATIFVFISIETLSFAFIVFSTFLMNGFFWGLGSISRLMALESFDTDIRAYSSGWRSFAFALGLTIGSWLSGWMYLELNIDLHYIYVMFGIMIIILIPVLVWKFIPETTGKDLTIEHLD